MAEEKKRGKPKLKSDGSERTKSKKKLNKEKRHRKKDKKDKQFKSKEEVDESASSGDETNFDLLSPPTPSPNHSPHKSPPESPCAPGESRKPSTPDAQGSPTAPGDTTKAPSPGCSSESQTSNSAGPSKPNEESGAVLYPRRNLSAEFDAASKESCVEGIEGVVVPVTVAPSTVAIRVVIPDGVPTIKGMENKAEIIAAIREAQLKSGIRQPNWNHMVIFNK